MIKLLLTCILMLSFGGVSAAEYSVRVGAHEEFTRVVLRFDELPKYKIVRSAGFTSIRFENDISGYIGVEWKQLVSRTRLIDILQSSPDALTLQTCQPCDLGYFRFGDSSLVLDVRDVGAPFDIAYSQVLPSTADTSSDVVALGLGYEPLVYGDFSREPRSDLGLEELTNSLVGIDEMNLRDSSRSGPVGQGGADLELSTELVRAAGLGLLEVSAFDSEGVQAVDTQLAPNGLPVEVKIENSPDGNEYGRFPANAVSTCLNESDLSLDEVGTLAPSQVGSGRDLFEINRALASGFAEEALKLMDLLNETPEILVRRKQARLMSDMPNIEVAEGTHFSSDASCTNYEKLWSFLEAPRGSPRSAEMRQGILAGFSELPPGARSRIAFRISERFVALGDYDSAAVVMRSVRRVVPHRTAADDLIQAKLELQKGNYEVVVSIIDRRRFPSSLTLYATALKLEAMRASKDEMLAQAAERAREMAVESEQGLYREELYQQTILSLFDVRVYQAAIELFVECIDKRFCGDSSREEIYAYLYRGAAGLESDAEVLKVVDLMGMLLGGGYIETGDAQMLHARLEEMGFADLFDQLLRPAGDNAVPAFSNESYVAKGSSDDYSVEDIGAEVIDVDGYTSGAKIDPIVSQVARESLILLGRDLIEKSSRLRTSLSGSNS